MKSLKPSHGVIIGVAAFAVGYWIGKKKQVPAVAVAMIGVGIFLMRESYLAFHDKTTATPLTKAKSAVTG